MPSLHPRPAPLAVMLAAAFPLLAASTAQADEPAPQLPDVAVTAPRIKPLPAAVSLERKRLASLRATTTDTAALLGELPGVALSSAGGVSSLPVIRGFADDRNRIQIDGMDLISACGNHMNPPLSYLDPSRLEAIRVYSGATPVSLGGDSIGGTIVARSRPPRFAEPGEAPTSSGEAGVFYRSNGDAHGARITANWAGESLAARYSGSTAQARNYRSAKDFKAGASAANSVSGPHWIAGDEVASSAYRADNHALDLAFRHDRHQLGLEIATQHIPYQGFPNQHMDMTDNRSSRVNLGYQGRLDWGSVEGRVYHESTRHKMDFGPDKLYWYGAARNVAGMPMDTHGRNTGARLKVELTPTERDTLRLGVDLQRYRLDDQWAPVANSMMMSPDTFWNIRDGQRDRNELFAEWEAAWSPRWLTLAGVRAGTVRSDAGKVQGYNTMAMMYGNDAARFNAADRSVIDHNLDATLLARFTPGAGQSFEAGYSRKTRSPSLYERYTWSTNGMAVAMNNWVNDGNGYVGDIALKPEVAHTLSLATDFHDATAQDWALRIAPYISWVDDYINARCLTSCVPGRFNALKVANTDARLYGIDVSGHALLHTSEDFGRLLGKAVVGYVKGKDTRSDDGLYNIMPINARLTLEQQTGAWTHAIDGIVVAAKRSVSEVRNEIRTAGYGLINLRSGYDERRFRIDVGIENLFNKQYALPLGGAYIGQGSTMSLNGTGAPYGITVPGMGRSLYAGLTVRF
ncbi:MAG: TonB-dependent receptor [Proteobacteria bacterium]|nr:TonB-dependent receptor [Pseudomonadota bacterium]